MGILAREELAGVLYWNEFAVASRLPTTHGASDFVVTVDPLDGTSCLTEGWSIRVPCREKQPAEEVETLCAAGPMAKRFEAAGGVANDGKRDIGSIYPKAFHEPVPSVLDRRRDAERNL